MSYPSDLTDAQWNIIESILPATKDRGTKRKYSKRSLLNAIFYTNKTGCQWRFLPKDFPPWSTVYKFFLWLSNRNVFEKINQELTKMARVADGRKESPSLVCMDSQSVKGDVNLLEKGIDGNKKVNGRKRHIVTDVMGFIIFCTITAANISDITVGRELLIEIQTIDTIKKVLVDQAYQGLGDSSTKHEVEISSKNPGVKGFVPIAKRWVVERTFAWLMRYRRLCRDYEFETTHQQSMVYVSIIKLILNRITKKP